nr:XRE family transcriptional regulator [uncultured Cellulosilyticum sp.]
MNNMVNKINDLLEQKGISCLELSRMTGIANTTLSTLLKGRTDKFDVVKLNKICAALNCTLDYLMDDSISDYIPKSEGELVVTDKDEKDLLVLFREAKDAPAEVKKQILNQVESSIDIYLKAKGLK